MFNLKMSKKTMKKFWSLMLVALVTLGAAACTENDENVDAKQEAGLSFYAEIANDTRAYIDDADGDKIWETIWESGDILEVSVDGTKMFNFTYDGEKFTCNEPGVTELLGQKVMIISRYQDRNSYAGKRGWGINGTQVENFTTGSTVTFEAYTSFFRYTYNGDGAVTFTVKVADENPPYVFQDGNVNFFEDITISDVKGENFIPFWTQRTNLVSATLSYSIDGVKCKETVLNLQPGKVYNLGILTDPVASAYSVVGTNNNWTAGETPMYVVGDYYVAYGVEFTADGTFKVLGNDKWLGTDSFSLGVWTAVNTANGGDISIVAGTYDFYFSEADSKICVVEAGAVVPEMPSITWALAGTFNNWADMLMTATATNNVFVIENIELAAGAEIKVKDSTTWDISFGRGVQYLAANSWMVVYKGSNANITIAKSGIYDIYFEYHGDESKVYLMDVDASHTTATEQSTDGTFIPDEIETPDNVTPGEVSEWALVGDFNDTTTWVEKQMLTTSTGNLFVVEDVVIQTNYMPFLIKKYGDTTWSVKYGGGNTNLYTDMWSSVVASGADMNIIEAGTYDIYFDLSNLRVYVMTADVDYTTATEQTENGPGKPIDNTRTIYLNAGGSSLWDQANAYFEAWVWGSSIADSWYDFVSVGNGIYSIDVPNDCTGMKILRKAPTHASHTWTSWNDTGDLTIPADKNMYTITGWNAGQGTWSTYNN